MSYDLYSYTPARLLIVQTLTDHSQSVKIFGTAAQQPAAGKHSKKERQKEREREVSQSTVFRVCDSVSITARMSYTTKQPIASRNYFVTLTFVSMYFISVGIILPAFQLLLLLLLQLHAGLYREKTQRRSLCSQVSRNRAAN